MLEQPTKLKILWHLSQPITITLRMDTAAFKSISSLFSKYFSSSSIQTGLTKCSLGANHQSAMKISVSASLICYATLLK